jgi:Fe-S cluster assembly scaffold IscU
MFLTKSTRTIASQLTPQLTANHLNNQLVKATTVIQKRNYDQKVIDHYNNPKNVGSFDKSEENVGTGLVGAPACGDVMKLQIKVDKNGKICDARFKTFGCASAIASSSYASEYIKGKSLDEAALIKNTVIANELKLPPVKLHCSMLAEDAIKAAIQNYKKSKDADKKE